ncbi:MAG: outer membrane protein assembly factor BamD [Bacteroidaceae bacterium]|nr:outer membrane protein assembly factor BamD [Bacteroidaceae bacterium]
MKKQLIFLILATLVFSSCAKTYNAVLKSNDYEYKYEYAKESFARGKYMNAISVLQDVVSILKGTENGEESIFMLGMAEFNDKDYETAAEYFRKYFKSYPKGIYAETACYYIGESLFFSTPEPRLDQSETVTAIAAFQEFLDIYTDSSLKYRAQERLVQLQDKLVKKEYLSAQLYYNLGSYFGNCLDGGNNFEACIITAQNALKDYPYCNNREEFALLIMKSKYHLAKQSVEAKMEDRYRDAEDECYGFINEYPDSKDRKLAEDFIKDCKKHLGEKDNSQEEAS